MSRPDPHPRGRRTGGRDLPGPLRHRPQASSCDTQSKTAPRTGPSIAPRMAARTVWKSRCGERRNDSMALNVVGDQSVTARLDNRSRPAALTPTLGRGPQQAAAAMALVTSRPAPSIVGGDPKLARGEPMDLQLCDVPDGYVVSLESRCRLSQPSTPCKRRSHHQPQKQRHSNLPQDAPPVRMSVLRMRALLRYPATVAPRLRCSYETMNTGCRRRTAMAPLPRMRCTQPSHRRDGLGIEPQERRGESTRTWGRHQRRNGAHDPIQWNLVATVGLEPTTRGVA
jgi:hypothetical protein